MPMPAPKTPIEQVVNSLRNDPAVAVDTVLIPEQCAIVYIGDRAFHITAEPMPEQE